LYLRYHPHLAERHVTKSHEATPFASKVLAANTLHFKAIFDPPLKKVVRGAAVPNGGALVRLGHSLAHASVSEIFAVELRSRPKSGHILHVFRP